MIKLRRVVVWLIILSSLLSFSAFADNPILGDDPGGNSGGMETPPVPDITTAPVDGTPVSVSPSDDVIIKAGLFYGNDALASANLANETGSGYRFGYFNDDRAFVPVYQVASEKISVLKDKAIYIAGDGTYTDAKPASTQGTVYPYHAQSQPYGSLAEAAAAAGQIAGAAGVSAFPAYVNGAAVVRAGAYASAGEAQSGASNLAAQTGLAFSAVGGSGTCYTVTVTGTAQILFEYDNGGPFGILPLSSGAPAQTWFKGFKYYGGFEYHRANGNDITVINVVGANDYVKGVIPYEMGASWPAEALKAQALCAKSYAMSNRLKHRSYGFDVCNTTDCQVYRGTNAATAASDAACDATLGMFVTYQGGHITPFYHSSNGGATEDSENIWANAVPYLKAVSDPYEDLDSAHNGKWAFRLSFSDATEILKEKGVGNAKITSIYIEKYTGAGNVYCIAFKDANGKVYRFEKERARTILNSSSKDIYTHSQRYQIVSDLGLVVKDGGGLTSVLSGLFGIGRGSVIENLKATEDTVTMISKDGLTTGAPKKGQTGDYVMIEGRGWGHNVGMSQWGARGMAERGFTYIDILKYYFTGVDVRNLG